MFAINIEILGVFCFFYGFLRVDISQIIEKVLNADIFFLLVTSHFAIQRVINFYQR